MGRSGLNRKAEGRTLDPRRILQLYTPHVLQLRSGDGLRAKPLDGVFYAIAFLGALAVVETVKGAYQIAGDAADALKGMVAFAAAAPKATTPLSASAASPAIWSARWTVSTTASALKNATV